MRKTLTLLAAALVALLLAPLTATAQSEPVTVSFSGLEPLGDSAVYEGWLIIDGEPYSTGTFNIGADGAVNIISPRTVENANAASTYVLTIEPANDPDPAPAATHVLAGDFVDGTARLSIGHPAALGTDFSDAGGTYIIATPTTSATDDELSGVWFLDPTGANGPVPSLDLPTLPEGWHYEGWAVIDGQPISTGRFTSVTGADDFSSFSGPDGNPPFPGEDFIINAPNGLFFPTNLSGATIVISVEPEPDDSPAPFALKPLVGQVPGDVTPATPQPLGDGPVGISGTATINGAPAAASSGAAPAELAFTGAESWVLAGGAVALIAIGAAFVTAGRRQMIG
jgi:hypothetical protein